MGLFSSVKSRKFNSERFRLIGWKQYKQDAQKVAADSRKYGHKARVTRYKKGWAIWQS